jgi:hypothetical protein
MEHVWRRSSYIVLAGKPEGKMLLGRFTHNLDDTKMDIRETG